MTYVTVVFTLSERFTRHPSVIVALAFWCAGYSFLPYPIKYPSFTQHCLILVSNYMLISLFSSSGAPLICVLCVVFAFGSLPRMYDLNPCSILFGVPMFLLFSLVLGVSISALLPGPLIPLLFFKPQFFEDQFNREIAELSIQFSVLLFTISQWNY